MRIFISCFIVFLFLGCKEDKKYHEDPLPVAGSPFQKEIHEHRASLNEFFRDPETSPLPDRYRADFERLQFFPPDSNYRVKAHIQRTPDAAPFLMPTTTDLQLREKVYGIATFQIDNKEYRLNLYESAGADENRETLFLPFTDATNGTETYTGGRYIDLDYPEGDSLVIDFNKAYNPFCVYNKKYSCPLVPRSNSLDIEIPAGIKMFNP